MDADLVIRSGLVVDGTGAPGRVADVVIVGDRVVAVESKWAGTATRTIDATDRVVTPGFVDVHTHLDAQLAWDPLPTSSCWHGVTSAVLGNCGVTFAPVRGGQREFLAEIMESVEDIPRAAILDGLPWDWEGYGDYLAWLDRIPKGINVGGMVGHVALRVAAMDDRSFADGPVAADDIATMCQMLDEALAAGALGVSTSRTYLHVVPDGRQVPGTFAHDDELLAFADVLARHGRGLFEGAMRLGERDSDELPNTRAEVAMLGEFSRRSGRAVSFGLTQSDRRPELFRRVVELVKDENARGANVRPQTTARGIGGLFGLANRTPWDRLPAWKELQRLPLAQRLDALRNPERRARLVAEANAATNQRLDPERMYVLPPGEARYDCRSEDSLASHAARRGVTPVEAFLDLAVESNGGSIVNVPFLNQRLEAVEEMLDDPVVTLGLADAGAHVGQIMDTSQPTFLLTYWVRERQRWTIEESVRRLTSDTADLFGVKDRGRLTPGSFADVNVIDMDALTLHQPEFVHDFPNGAGRYVQRASGYDATIVNGNVFMEHGEHTGALAGVTVRSTD
jgi:N-acyl-D-amino-acid deacylase